MLAMLYGVTIQGIIVRQRTRRIRERSREAAGQVSGGRFGCCVMGTRHDEMDM